MYISMLYNQKTNNMYIQKGPSENQQYSYSKTKAQISFAVTAQLISAFVFAT